MPSATSPDLSQEDFADEAGEHQLGTEAGLTEIRVREGS